MSELFSWPSPGVLSLEPFGRSNLRPFKKQNPHTPLLLSLLRWSLLISQRPWKGTSLQPWEPATLWPLLDKPLGGPWRGHRAFITLLCWVTPGHGCGGWTACLDPLRHPLAVCFEKEGVQLNAEGGEIVPRGSLCSCIPHGALAPSCKGGTPSPLETAFQSCPRGLAGCRLLPAPSGVQ